MKDSLGDRMKRYENVWKQKVVPRTPLIIRLDGKAFHSYLRPVRGKFHDHMKILMSQTTQYLVKNIQNCEFGYTQSDEISLLLNDFKALETQQWFGGSQQKMETISASMATGFFNGFKEMNSLLPEVTQNFAMFDARVFTIPKEEVANYFIWRQQDATRNSISMLGQMFFSHNELQGKSSNHIQDMLMEKYSINWNDLEIWKKRGLCVSRNEIDLKPPIFTQDRNYIEQHLLTSS